MRYAYRPYKGADSVYAAPEDQPAYHERTFQVVHRLGGPSKLIERKPGVAFPRCNYTTVYDARIISPADEATLTEINRQIATLQADRRRLITERYLTWPLVTKDTCARVIPGQTKAQAKAKLPVEAKS